MFSPLIYGIHSSNGLASSALEEIINAGGVAYWALDETSGSTLYDSIGSMNGNINVAPTFDSDVMGGSVSMLFNGSTQYCTITRPGTMTNDFSISFWIKLLTNSTNNGTWYQNTGVISGEHAGSLPGELSIHLKDNKFLFVMNGIRESSLQLSLNTPTFITFTKNYSSGACKVYFNGTEDSSATGTLDPNIALNTSVDFEVAKVRTLTYYCNANFNNIAFYNTELTSSNISDIYTLYTT